MKYLSILFFAAAFTALSCNNKLKIKSNSFNLGEPFGVKMNEMAKEANGGLQLTLTAIPEDSRCPVDVNCIWEGQVKVFMEAAVPAQKRSLEFKVEKSKMGTVSKTFEGYNILINKVVPDPVSGKKTSPGEYVVELLVTKG